MTTFELLARLRGRNIKLWAEGDRLRFQAPKGALTDELRAALAEHKAEVLALLQEVTATTHEAPAPIERAPNRDNLPLSFSQERLWFLDQLEPGSPFYSLPFAVRLRGELDVAVLEQAFTAVIARHEALRTTFVARDGQPVQVIAPPAPLPLPRVDLRQLPGAEREATALHYARAEAQQPFDLQRGPLLRTTLLQLDAADSVLLVTLHHIIADGWSVGLLIRDLAQLYAALAHDRPASLPPLPVQYADFAHWQRHALTDQRLQLLLTAAIDQLHGAPTTLDLPTDHPRPPVQSVHGATLPVRLPHPLTQALLSLSQAEGATLFMTLLAAFQVLLARYTGQDALLVGSPIAGRTRAELDDLIGCFVNTLVLRADLAGQPTFTALLARTRATTLRAYEQQDLPFERLVEALQPERDLSRSPLVQVMFALHNTPQETIALPELTLRRLAVDSGTAKFDLALALSETADGLVGTLEYATALFERASMERLLAHFHTLLAAIVADPQQPITTLPLLTDTEQHQLLVDWNATAAWFPRDLCLPQLVEAQAAEHPEAIAIACAEQTLTYAELDRRANQLAHQLQALGVGPDVRVGLLLTRSPDFAIGALGVLKAGGAYLPIDIAYPPDRIQFMLADAQAPILLTQSHLLQAAPSYELRTICLDTDWPTIAQQPETPPRSAATAEHLAYVIYTSGSTGLPKGVGVPHRGALNLVTWHRRAYDISPDDRATLLAGLAFDASVWELWPYLASGASLHLPDDEIRSTPGALVAWLIAQEITICFMPTPLAEAVLAEPNVAQLSLRALLTGGDVLHAQDWSRLSFPVINHYGPTENTVVTTCEAVETTSAALPSIGRPIANTQVYLLDSNLQPVPIGVAGQLYIGGDNLARGYLSRPALTAERFVPNPFGGRLAGTSAGSRLYRTGDLGRYLPDGRIDFLGRIDHQVKIRGFRIEIGEIEAVLLRHPDVRDAVVVAREDSGEKRLVAYVVENNEQRNKGTNEQTETAPPPSPVATEAEARRGSGQGGWGDEGLIPTLRTFLTQRLPDYMVPSAFVMLDALPLTPNGKVDRKALPAPDDTSSEIVFVAPRTATEAVLVDLWSEILGARRIGVHDNFFALGGHSLLATQLVSRIRAALAVELPLRQIFAAPTVAELAQHIAALRASDQAQPDAPPIQPTDRSGPLPLSFSQERLWFLDQLEPNSPLYSIPFAVRLRGELDVAVLEEAFTAVIARHEALRTTFVARDGQPVQVIAPPAPLRLPRVDLRQLPGAKREATALHYARAEAATPFDLHRGPLLRTTLLQLDADDSVLLVTLHHIIADGWSVGLLIRDLAQLYAARATDLPHPEGTRLPPLPVQYADFAHWQRHALTDQRLQLLLTAATDLLHDAPTTLDLPTDHPRPPVQSVHGATLLVRLPHPLTQALLALSQAEGATLFMTLLAAFQVLLARYTGQDALLVGSPIAGRTRAELDDLIGCFVNTLVLRADLAGQPTFTALLARVRTTTLRAYEQQDLPFERLVEAMQPARDLSRSPLVQVMFALHNTPQETIALPGLTLRRLAVDSGTAKFDLALALSETADGLVGTLEYATALFERPTMERLLAHFHTLLTAIVADPQQPITTLPLLTDAEQQLLVDWNMTSLPYPQDQCLHQLVEAQVARTPEAIALQCGAATLTYAELNARANQLAHQLQALGVGPDVRVGLCLHRSLDLVIGLLGILKAGGAYVPIDPSYPAERIAFLLADAQLGGLVTQAALGETLPPFAGVTVRLDADTATIAQQPTTNPHPAVTPQDLAYVIYTSGSTGRPKGVLVEHRQVVNTLWGSRQEFGFTAADVLPWLASVAFDIAVFELFSPLLVGGTTLIVQREEILDLAHLSVLLQRCTLLHAVPALLRQIVQQADAPYPQMRRVFVGGEAVPPDLLAALPAVFRQAQVEVLYGPTETAILCTHYAVPPDTVLTAHPIGRPLPNHQIRLYDKHGQLVPIGVAGEIYVGGAGVTRGYLNRPELTAEKFVTIEGQRWYRTGDLARWRHAGTLEFLGRIDHQVKIRGFRIELGEIEAVLGQHPDVNECVVVVREDLGEKRLVAYVVENQEPRTQNPEDDTDGSRFLVLGSSELRQHLKERLPDYMIPAAFVRLDALPKTLTGKLDRAALPAPALHPTIDDTFQAPTSPVEELLAGIWAEVLGVQRLSTRANFFALGGHSLLATQLVSRIRSALAVELPLRQIFAAPTIAELAQHIAALRASDQAQPDAPPIQPTDHSQPLPLSFSQERLWFLDQLEPNSPLYSIPFVLRVTGRLALSAFESSLNTMISRHEILRTSFKLADGQPTQVIAPSASIELPVINLRHLPADERETAARELVSLEAHTPFDLDRGPLLRVTLIQMDDSESLVLFTLHHIIADGWSTSVIVREFGPLYSAFARDEQPALPDLPIQYADFAVWQREWLQGAVLHRQLSYWRQQLGDESSRGAIPLLDLPTDRPRPAVPSYAGETIKFTLPQPLTDAVVALSQREQVTPFMTLLAAFQVLLFRYSGQDDIAVGTPIANRNRREIEPLIGCFINTLVIRTDLSGVPSFHELLGRVRQSTLGAYDHQDLPFEVLVDALHPTRRLSHNPIFQVMFTLQNTPRVAIETPDLQLAPVEIEYQRAKFDLTLTMSETPAGLVGALEYRTDLFDAATIERMAGHFQMLLAAIVTDPERRIDHLPLLPIQEQQILQSWNATRVTAAPERWTHELFEDQVARTPEAVALMLDAEQLTYAELNTRANQLAHHLRTIGVRQESLVAVCLHRSMDLVVALLAILKAGGCYVPLDPAYPADRLRWMLDDTRAAVIVSSSRQQALLPAHSAHVLCLDTDSALIDHEPTTTPESFISGASLAYVIYTSGSTGKPKGVGVGHAALVEHTVGIAELYELDLQDRVLEFASPSFDVSIEQILPTLISGACLVLRSAELWSPDEFTNVIMQKRLTVLNLPPVYYRAWMLALTEANTPLPQQPRLIIVGGEAFPPDIARLWRQLDHGATRLLNAYGPTETIITATLYDMSAADDAHALLSSVPIGRPIVERTAYVLDRAGAQMPIGVPGELYLGGSLLARGYLNRPDLTATQFVPDPFSQISGARLYRTGDLVRFLADGTIEFLGRVDDQVKVRGFRIELGEIEAVLATHPAVQTALVVLRDERLVAYVVEEPRTQNLEPNESQAETPLGSRFSVLGSALREFLAQRLPEYMVPSTFIMLPALPLSPNGKLDRKALPALESTQIDDGESFAAPRTPAEELIAGVWASVLGVERVGIHDNFFALGGHSLLATQVVSRLRQVLSVELPLRALFEAPTVAGLAAQLSSQRAATETPLQPVDRSGPLPLSFAQQRLWFLDQLEPGSSLYNLPAGLRVRGTLDRDALRQSIDLLVARHESLRTTFAAMHGQPVQVIAPAAPLDLATVDLQPLPPHERQAAAMELAIEEARQPFDLQRGPLLRATLVLLDPDDYLLLFTLHHIITDGWSLGVLIREVAATYQALSSPHPEDIQLRELPIQYADYAVWQREWLQGDVLHQQLDYWRQQLQGSVPLDLPTDRPRPLILESPGTHLPLSLSADLSAGLQRLSQRLGATLFMTLLAAWQTLLHRYSGQTDISVGSPIAGRVRPELEDLIGFFVNTLVLRTDLSGAPTFADLVTRVRQVALGAYAHQDLPFEQIVEAVQPARDLSRTPLFQVMFVLQNTPRAAIETSDLQLEPLEIEKQSALFDLTLTMIETPAGLVGALEYRTDLFDAATIERMAGRFQTLLAAIVADPQQRIDRLPLLDATEQQAMLSAWNTTEQSYPHDLCLHDLVAAQVLRTPEAVALVFGAERLTYGELDRRANQLAHHLQNLGVGPEVRVGVCLHRSPELVVALLAVLKAGGCYVPLDPAYPTERLAFMLDDARAGVLLTRETLVASLPAFGNPIVGLDRDQARIASQPSTSPETGVQPANLAYMIYTSGSTGRPKAVMVTHQAICNHLHWRQHAYPLDAADRFLHKASFSFDISVWECFAPLIAGAALVLASDEEAQSSQALVGLLADEQVTIFHAGPALLRLLLDEPRIAECRSVRHVFSGGEQLTLDLKQHCLARLGWAALHHQYGPTEACVDATVWTCGREEAETTIPIGRPIANTQCYILDTQMQPVPIGVAGELHLGGLGLARGYHRQSALTANQFVPDPFSQIPGARLYKTGDLARYRADGAIVFLGRVDFQVKLRGFRVELGEIESVLHQHPAVRAAVVVLRDERLVAYVVEQRNKGTKEQENRASTDDLPSPTATEAEAGLGSGKGLGVRATTQGLSSTLREFLAQHLPEYMVPSIFVMLPALPLSPNGKLDRKALPAPDDLTVTRRAFVAPRTPAEELIASVWASVLGVERVGIHDNFFEIGGHSLLATQVVSRLRQVLSVELPLRALFEVPTVAGLAAQLTTQQSEAQTAIQPVDRSGLLPLSFAQQRLWFLDQLEPGSPLYNLPASVRLQGTLDHDALRQSLDLLVARHESLRTTFAAVHGQPVQVIAPAAPLTLATVDLQPLPPHERQAAAMELVIEDARQPFDLQRGPLLRATLVLLDPDDYLLLFTLHHIITDGWSMGVLIRELAAIYLAVVDRRPVMLPELPIQYPDFAVWQREWFQGDVLHQQLDYWKQQLSGAPSALDLPTDRPRPLAQSFRGAALPLNLSSELTQALLELSQREGATLFMTLLAAWQTLLFRYSGQDDILVGSPIANRTRPELEGLIGFFANTLVLRTDLSGDPPFTELLARARQTALEAYAHQDLPFEMLVEAVQPERDLSRTPLFQVMFVLQNTPSRTVELPDLTLQLVDAHSGTAKFDLLLSIVEHPNGLACDLEYNTDLFDQATMARLLEHFHRLLSGIVANPAQPLSSLPLLSDAERRQQLVDWNATAAPYPALAVHQLIEQQAARTPDAVAVVFGADHLTYRELDRRANQLAHHLRALGVERDVPVGLCMERSLHLVVGILGILKAGGAYVPLDPHYPAERLELMLSNAQAPVVLTAPSQAADPRAVLAERFSGIVIDLVDDWALIDRQPTHAPEAAFDLDQLAYVIYTSGSTGLPKGVAMPHRPLVNLITWQQTVIPGAARTLQFASPSFDVSFQEIFTTWASGGTLVLPSESLRRDPEALAAFLDEQRIERLFLPFVALQQLAEVLLAEGRVPAHLRDVITAGEQLQITPAIAAWFRSSPQCRLHNHYGPSETHAVTSHTLSGDPSNWPALPPIGKPIANTRVYLLDRAAQPVPLGVIGELYFAGTSQARGYLHRPELTAERFITLELADSAAGPTRAYKTGDLARYRPDGVLEFLGRADTQVKIRGYRVEPGEIENVLAQHTAVREAVVVVRPNAQGMAQLVAYVVPEENKEQTNKEQRNKKTKEQSSTESPPRLPQRRRKPADVRGRGQGGEGLTSTLRAYLKEKLPDYMVPSAFVLLERWPLTPSGKIDRRTLPAPDGSADSTSDSFVAPRDTLELRLTRIWEELLGVQPVGIRDNFFTLGGHSLLVVRLMAQIQTQLGQRLPLATLFQEPTVEHLARTLRHVDTPPLDSPLIPVQPGGDKLPFFCVHPAAGSVLSYLELARLLGPDQPFYAFQAVGLDAGQPPHTQVETMAAAYLAALRTAQPKGPYRLGGWSFGGLVAYEMARQLTAQGEEVALLALIDTWAPRDEAEPAVDQTTLLRWFANDLGRTVGADLTVAAETLATLPPEQQLASVLHQARASGALPADIGERELRAYLAVFTASLQAMQDYRPRPYAGRVTLFRAGDRPLDDAGETLGWDALVADGVSLRVIPGDHYTIVRQPHVAALAEQLRASLVEVQTLHAAHPTDK